MVQQINYNVYRIAVHQSEARNSSSDARGPFYTGRPKYQQQFIFIFEHVIPKVVEISFWYKYVARAVINQNWGLQTLVF